MFSVGYYSLWLILLLFVAQPLASAHAEVWQQYNNMLSLKDAAALALLVYHDHPNTTLVPPGFKLLCTCPVALQQHDYYGEAYYRINYHEHPSSITIVITHRGTIISLDNLIDDLFIALKITPQAFKYGSRKFTDYVEQQSTGLLASIKQEKIKAAPPIHFIHVGHSLGAIHAVLSYLTQLSRYNLTQLAAIGFESPGALEIINNIIKAQELPANALFWAKNALIINNDVNAINAVNTHLAPVLGIHAGHPLLVLPWVQLAPTDVKFFLSFFTWQQHSMQNIYTYLASTPQITAQIIANYPSNLSQAFHYYLTYDPDPYHYHRNYWHDILSLYWDYHPNLHNRYHYNKDAYIADIIQRHLY